MIETSTIKRIFDPGPPNSNFSTRPEVVSLGVTLTRVTADIGRVGRGRRSAVCQ